MVVAFLLLVVASVGAWSEPSQPAVLLGSVKQRLVLDDALLKSLPGVVTIELR